MPVPDIEHDNKHTQPKRKVLTGNSHVDASLKPCRYRGHANGEVFSCDNTTDLIHGGFVTSQFCTICPYAVPPAVGFFAQTEQLLIQKARRGEITVAAKPCGGCNEVKRRETDVMQFVYPYWHFGANDDEIRWSVRSVEQNYQGTSKITIIGDKPPWYAGHYIPQRRVHKHTTNRPFRDMLTKVWTMATHPEIDQEFVWMMDDVYLIKPFTVDELAVPRAVRWQESESNSWQRRKKNTMRALAQAGHTVHDYATHLPHVVEKDKLRQLYEEFGLQKNTMLWEVLYGNTFRGHPQSPFPFFRRIQKKISLEDLKQLTEQASVFNHTSSAWCPGVRQFLAELLPNPSSCESEHFFMPKYKVTQRVRPPVKRRPPETHRVHIEALARQQAGFEHRTPRSGSQGARVGFLSAAYMPLGGTETFHRSLIPRLKKPFDITGFVATAFHGGNGELLKVPYSTGIEAAVDLAAKCDILVTWGVQNLETILPQDRPKVIAVHHSDWSSGWNNELVLNQLDVIDEVVCVNEHTAGKLAAYGKPVHHIPNAIDPMRVTPSGKQHHLRSQFRIPEESKIVLFGHRLSSEKRPVLALQIANELPPGWVMVIAGDGPERDIVSEVSDRVRVVGLCESLADWLAISSCFLSLSTFEGFGLSIGEAMAAGVPTVSTPVGIAPGLATTLPIDSTVAEWAAAIVNSTVRIEAKEIIQRFSVDRMVDAWKTTIETIIGSAGKLETGRPQ